MKRSLMLLLVLSMLVLLTGCKSADYKQAHALYDTGDFMQAKTMFEALEDYQDSQEMAVKCVYSQAQALYNSKDYASAKQLFSEVADYEDSRDMIVKCTYAQGKQFLDAGNFAQAEACLIEVGDYEDAAQLLKNLPYTRLMHYLEHNGELMTRVDVSKDTHYFVTLRKLTDDTIEITYDLTGSNSTVTSKCVATMVLVLGQTKMQVLGTDEMTLSVFGKTSTTEEAVEGELDIRTYRYGDGMIWDKTYFKGYNIYGEPLDPKVSGLFQVASNAPLERAFQAVETMLAENNVGVTLNQIGFASLG